MQGEVRVEHLALDIGESDADGRLGEQGPETGLAGAERGLGLFPGVQHRLADGLLLVQGALAQCVAVAACDGPLNSGEPFDGQLRHGLADLVAEECDAAFEGGGTGEVAVHQIDADVPGGSRVERVAGEDLEDAGRQAAEVVDHLVL